MMKYTLYLIILSLLFTVGCSISDTVQSNYESYDSNIDVFESSVQTQIEDNNESSLYSADNSEDSIDNFENSQLDVNINNSKDDESSTPEESDTDMESDWKLIVNGMDITDGEYAEMISDGNSIPFVAVMEALGAEFEWENDRMARMKYLDLFFVLDVDKCILISEANDQEFFFVVGHMSIPSMPMDKELVLATARVLDFFRKAGITRYRNCEDRIVTINSNPDNVSYDAFTKTLFDYLT